jgi:hypothetical protein
MRRTAGVPGTDRDRARLVATTMNWTGAQAGEGVEYHPLALVTPTAAMVRGSGVWSLDRGVSPPRPADAARLAEA